MFIQYARQIFGEENVIKKYAQIRSSIKPSEFFDSMLNEFFTDLSESADEWNSCIFTSDSFQYTY